MFLLYVTEHNKTHLVVSRSYICVNTTSDDLTFYTMNKAKLEKPWVAS